MPPNPHFTPLDRIAPGQHRGTDQQYTHHHKQWDSKKKETLCKKNDSPMGDAVGQEDLQGHDGPEQGGSMTAPENQKTQEALIRSYGQHR